MQNGAEKIRQTSDPILLLALVAAFVFCLHGLTWGRVEDWNPDQMALRGMTPLLKPGGFLKPPFHTFVNHILVMWPLQWLEFATHLITHRPQNFVRMQVLASHLIVLAMFLGSVLIAWKIAHLFYGRKAAGVLAVLFATSAGFIAETHFLTADIPLTFWMLVAMMLAARIMREPTTKNYVAAGICAGLATATKYNGLAVGLAMVVAHLLSQPRGWRALWPDRRILLGLAMVPVGFVLGNPYAVLSWRKFSADFVYNYAITPQYGGETGLGFGKFVQGIRQILGLPGAILIGVLAIWSALLLVRPKRDWRATQCFLLFASVFLLYALKIGSFPRVPTRFVLPAVPLLVLMAGTALRSSIFQTQWLAVLLAPIVLYNCASSFYVGRRFADDPRRGAQDWMKANVRPGSRIESSAASPHWARLPQLNAVELNVEEPKWKKVAIGQTVDLRMPRPNTRYALFSRVFADNETVRKMAQEREKVPDETQFSLEKLTARNPDYVTVVTYDYAPEIVAVRKYYDDLLHERFPYKIVYDATTPRMPRWTYPQTSDFLGTRMIILARNGEATTR